jgi:ABC-type molybdate transport system substrate-binding protein
MRRRLASVTRRSAFSALALLGLALACRSKSEGRAGRGGESAAASSTAASNRLDVLATSSVEAAVRKAGQAFQTAHAGVEVRVQTATPAQLRARLGSDPKADVVVLEGELSDGPGLVPGSARKIGQSVLVLVRSRRADEIKRAADLPKASFPHFVLPDPAHNPSGAAAKAWLAATKVDDKSLLETLEPRLLPKPDARATLAELERRGRTMGVVLQIDLASAQTVKVVSELAIPPIAFTAGVVPGPNQKQAAEFVTLLAAHGLVP